MESNYRKWIFSGIAIFAVSIVGGVAGAAWGIASSFSALETAEIDGIEAVASGIETALILNILFLFTSFVGIALTVIGAIKGYKHSKQV